MFDDIGIAMQLVGASSDEELREALLKAAHSMGAGYYTAMGFSDTTPGVPPLKMVTNLPDGYHEAIGSEWLPGQPDPVMVHLRETGYPVFWDRDSYRTEDEKNAYNFDVVERVGARFDVSSFGVATALHLGMGRHFVLAFDWEHRRTALDVPQRPSALASTQAFAVFAEPAAFRFWYRPDRTELPAVDVLLTERERECIYWVGKGFTDRDIGLVLSISPATVRKHVGKAMLKLDAANRTEAAVLAVRRNLIDP